MGSVNFASMEITHLKEEWGSMSVLDISTFGGKFKSLQITHLGIHFGFSSGTIASPVLPKYMQHGYEITRNSLY